MDICCKCRQPLPCQCPEPAVSRLSREEHIAVANEIYRQLGGHKFRVMVGVEYLVVLNDYPYGGLQLRFKGSKDANSLRVIVDANDTYTVEFWKIGRSDAKVVKVFEGVYNDMLQDIFTDFTGLDTSLGTMAG